MKLPQKLIPLLASVSIKLTPQQLELCRNTINFHYLGDIHCNEYDSETGKIVPKYKEKTVEHCKVYGAHSEIPRMAHKSMTVWLMDNGTFAVDPSEKIDPITFFTVKVNEEYHQIKKGDIVYHCCSSEMGDRWFGYWADEDKKVWPVEIPQNICEIV